MTPRGLRLLDPQSHDIFSPGQRLRRVRTEKMFVGQLRSRVERRLHGPKQKHGAGSSHEPGSEGNPANPRSQSGRNRRYGDKPRHPNHEIRDAFVLLHSCDHRLPHISDFSSCGDAGVVRPHSAKRAKQQRQRRQAKQRPVRPQKRKHNHRASQQQKGRGKMDGERMQRIRQMKHRLKVQALPDFGNPARPQMHRRPNPPWTPPADCEKFPRA